MLSADDNETIDPMEPSDEHPSSSSEQRAIEVWALAEASGRLGVHLAKERIVLSDGAVVEIDGVDEAHTVACEVYAHVGELRGGQPKKLATDVLKLVVLQADQSHPSRHTLRIVMVVVDGAAARTLMSGRSWLGSAVRRFGVEVLLLDLSQRQRDLLIAVQKRQFR